MFIMWPTLGSRTAEEHNRTVVEFPKYSSLTTALLQTGLASSSTAMHNFTWRFKDMLLACDNAVVSSVLSLCS